MYMYGKGKEYGEVCEYDAFLLSALHVSFIYGIASHYSLGFDPYFFFVGHNICMICNVCDMTSLLTFLQFLFMVF